MWKLVVVVLAGCSFKFVDAPPLMPCTESRVAPIADTVIAPGLVTAGIFALAAPVTCPNMSTEGDCTVHKTFDGILQSVAGVALIAAAVPFVISAVHGYRATGRCRQLRSTRRSSRRRTRCRSCRRPWPCSS